MAPPVINEVDSNRSGGATSLVPPATHFRGLWIIEVDLNLGHC